MFWTITTYPRCTYHVFLSHSREDHESLVAPVHERLQRSGLVPWLDRFDYAYGRDSRASLRDAILRSRHTVFFITEAMLASARGWCVLELAFAELLQETLTRSGGVWANVVLPLYFVTQDNPTLPRTVWQRLRDRGSFGPTTAGVGQVEWAVEEIGRFIARERQLAGELALAAESSPELARELKRRPGLLHRATGFDPVVSPIADQR